MSLLSFSCQAKASARGTVREIRRNKWEF